MRSKWDEPDKRVHEVYISERATRTEKQEVAHQAHTAILCGAHLHAPKSHVQVHQALALHRVVVLSSTFQQYMQHADLVFVLMKAPGTQRAALGPHKHFLAYDGHVGEMK
jgi:hypothetical protein